MQALLKYASPTIGGAFWSALFVFGVQAQAAQRLCDPVPPLPLWGSLVLVALSTFAIVLYVTGNQPQPASFRRG